MISQICEEFGCLPSVAVNEPLDVMLKIMDARSYMRAKQLIERAQKTEDLPDNPMIDMVWEIQRDIVQEARAKRGR